MPEKEKTLSSTDCGRFHPVGRSRCADRLAEGVGRKIEVAVSFLSDMDWLFPAPPRTGRACSSVDKSILTVCLETAMERKKGYPSSAARLRG